MLAVAALTASTLLLGACSGGSGALDDQIQLVAGTAETNGAPPGTGDFATPSGGPPALPGPQAEMAERWVALKAGNASGVGQTVANGSGLTLYRFDRDSSIPPTSNCSGQCVQTWPKVLVGQDSKLFVGQGIDDNDVGSIPVGDGTYQITLGGWPVYRFSMDTKAGQANGQGVGGTWFAIAPNGDKASSGGGAYGNSGRDSNSGGYSNDNGDGGNSKHNGGYGDNNGGGGYGNNDKSNNSGHGYKNENGSGGDNNYNDNDDHRNDHDGNRKNGGNDSN